MRNSSNNSALKLPANASRFFGLLPRGGTATQESPPVVTPQQAPALRQSRILLVEDDHDLRLALKERLTHDGCVVTDVADGVSARWNLLSCRYDAVIMDLSLPNSSGVEVMADVSRSKSLPPVLVLTGGEAEDRDRARAMGATFVLKKPSPYSEVLGALERLLG